MQLPCVRRGFRGTDDPNSDGGPTRFLRRARGALCTAYTAFFLPVRLCALVVLRPSEALRCVALWVADAPWGVQIVLMLVWGFAAMSRVDPWDLGLAMLTVWPAVILALLAFMHWRAKGWHLPAVSKVNLFGSVYMMVAAVLALLLIWFDMGVALMHMPACKIVNFTTSSTFAWRGPAGKSAKCLSVTGATWQLPGCSCRSTWRS